MAGHFECIGFATSDQDAFLSRVSDAARTAQRKSLRNGRTLLLWDDPSGARLVIGLTPDNEVECLTPSFIGVSRVSLGLQTLRDTDDCEFCAVSAGNVMDSENECEAYPLAFQIDDFPVVRERLLQERVTLSVTAFAEDIRVWGDEADYNADESLVFGGEIDTPRATPLVRYGTESLVPTGMFKSEGGNLSPHILMSARVVRAQHRVNSETMVPFQWALVRTYAAQLDLVAAAADLPGELEPGNIVRGTFWCVGQVIEGLPTRPNGLLKRIFRN